AGRLARRLRANKRGSIAVEMAIVMSVIAVMIIGTFELALVLFEQMQLEKATQSAAHYSLLGQTDANDPEAIIAIFEREVGDTTGLSVNVNNYCGCPGEGEVACTTGSCADGSIPAVYMQVRATKIYEFLNGLFGMDTITLGARALVRAR
ncbi:MAG: pilus assembly protein, partial [Proteobacteria bacterium]|nr:pilus assembly protein [Pseudomonadota bacterium]